MATEKLKFTAGYMIVKRENIDTKQYFNFQGSYTLEITDERFHI
jgi:hypothetical protein